MKTLLLLLILNSTALIFLPTKVYICDSPTGRRYHLKNDCKGLSKCTHRIIGITLEGAKKRGMDLCKYEK